MIAIEYSRDSFDDRMCDDLTEVLISYLSFEDKIRFECVSNQFRELVFKRQRKLITGKWIRYQFDGICFFPKSSVEFDLKAFESVLTKCKSLDDIAFSDMRTDSMKGRRKHVNQVIELVIKHCRQLKSVQLDYFEAENRLVESFGSKFGQNLQHIDIDLESIWLLRRRQTQRLFKLCPNLVSIKGLDLKDLMIGNELKVLKKLSKVDDMRIGSREEILFTDFINKYENQLTSLVIRGIDSDSFFVNISRLKQLNEFSLCITWKRNTSELFTGLKQIGLNCKHLNKLALDIDIVEDDEYYDTKSFNQSLKDFKDLKQLRIQLYSLSFEKFCERIHIRFPKLESLEFNSWTEVNDNALKCLAELKTLRKFTLICYENSNITSEGILHLINSDNKLFYINIDSKFEITDGLIDGIKALTARNPKKVLKINFNFCPFSDNELKFRGIPGIYCLKGRYG